MYVWCCIVSCTCMYCVSHQQRLAPQVLIALLFSEIRSSPSHCYWTCTESIEEHYSINAYLHLIPSVYQGLLFLSASLSDCRISTAAPVCLILPPGLSGSL